MSEAMVWVLLPVGRAQGLQELLNEDLDIRPAKAANNKLTTSPRPGKDEHSEVVKLRQRGFEVRPGSVGELRNLDRDRTCYFCDQLGRKKVWKMKYRFAKYHVLETGEVVSRCICEDHARMVPALAEDE